MRALGRELWALVAVVTRTGAVAIAFSAIAVGALVGVVVVADRFGGDDCPLGGDDLEEWSGGLYEEPFEAGEGRRTKLANRIVRCRSLHGHSLAWAQSRLGPGVGELKTAPGERTSDRWAISSAAPGSDTTDLVAIAGPGGLIRDVRIVSP